MGAATPPPLLLLLVMVVMVLGGARALLTIDKWMTSMETTPGAQAAVEKVQREEPRLFMGTEELARSAGFEAEAQRVRTADGYLLTLHRLRPARVAPRGAPVLLVHGFMCASDLFLLTPPDHALAYLLVKRGYDVWLANLRGNNYSHHHERLSPSERTFWNFSWHEMGVWDLPASVDHVLRVSGHRSLYYVGHSMGNTVYYVMAAARPEYNAKVRLHVSLAPAVFMAHVRSQAVRLAAKKRSVIERMLWMTPEVLPSSSARSALLRLACRREPVCERAMQIAHGPTHPGRNASQIPFYMVHLMHGTSMRTLVHFLQSIVAGGFRQYDEGSAEANMRRYGRPSPPDYDLSLVTAPSAIFYSDDDYTVDSRDVQRLAREQRRVVLLQRVRDRPFNHLDFLLAPSARSTLYERVLELLTWF